MSTKGGPGFTFSLPGRRLAPVNYATARRLPWYVRRQPFAYRANAKGECYVIDRFLGTFAEWSEYCALVDAVAGLRVVRTSTENLRKFRFFKGVLETRFGSLELKIGSLESEKSGPYRSIPGT